MYDILLHVHSWTRWLVVVFGLIAVFRAFSGWQGRRRYVGADNGMGAAFVGSMHLQLLVGLILYLGLSPVTKTALANMGAAMKSPELRFWGVEHITVMVLAVIAAQVGRSLSKKATEPVLKHKRAFVWFTIALVLVLLMIPWGIWNPARPLFRF
ncbi:hypothetical protein [Hymenobacter sp. BT491]|uniref:hypothetical protein n=1 Tax=Hymenobacter sp. BT491 TaxID=2766779 RepID=UPI001653D6DB|nr:hypothetical protein [Hymenobacter sp. BT491]MBC6989292.1 hypothetical protein [Hymenobacter sp. BT491]